MDFGPWPSAQGPAFPEEPQRLAGVCTESFQPRPAPAPPGQATRCPSGMRAPTVSIRTPRRGAGGAGRPRRLPAWPGARLSGVARRRAGRRGRAGCLGLPAVLAAPRPGCGRGPAREAGPASPRGGEGASDRRRAAARGGAELGWAGGAAPPSLGTLRPFGGPGSWKGISTLSFAPLLLRGLRAPLRQAPLLH